MEKCEHCKNYKPYGNTSGKCLISKKGDGIKTKSTPSCYRFIKGKWDGLNKNEHNMKLIMDTISRCYQGGRWG